MEIEIIDKPFDIELYGYSGMATNYDYATAGRKLMDRMWQTIIDNNLKHKGINFWVYDGGNAIFTGLELETPPADPNLLEHKIIRLPKYAYYKHVGSYALLKTAYEALKTGIPARGLQGDGFYIERYGHWTPDETKLETEILAGLKG